MDVEDKELANFLAAEQGKFRYDYVRLGCSFHPDHPERFEKAWLYVDLDVAGLASGVPFPIAWSIYPVETHDEVEESLSTKIGSRLSIFSAEVGSSKKVASKLYSLRGYKEGKSDPHWEMRATDTSSLDGLLRFHIVVRSLASTEVRARVRLETTLSDRLFAVFRSQRPFDESPSLQFKLPSA
jgi:hypothetical protein